MFTTHIRQDPFGLARALTPRAAHPALVALEVRAWQAARHLAAQAADERGQSNIASGVVVTGIVVALAILVVGVILWNAIVGAAENTAADIEAAGNWSP